MSKKEKETAPFAVFPPRNRLFNRVINSMKLPSRDRKRSRLSFFTEKILLQPWVSQHCPGAAFVDENPPDGYI